jgi:gamma-glutamyl-gamma-aminobutyrate hydrolase PuuD
MMTVAITQRVSLVSEYGERRDCLDQAWPRFLTACGLMPMAVPNVKEIALALCDQVKISGLVLTGGNDLAELGGDAPERDDTEHALLDAAQSRGMPVLAVCRGMQLLQRRSAISLRRVEGHVAKHQTIRVDGAATEVNSYHHYAAFESKAPLETWAVADDGVIKAVRDPTRLTIGIMWHPERNAPFAARDIALFRRAFNLT